jgi:hypothetical protein
MNETTGQLVMWLTNSMTKTSIGRDRGHYEGTLEELNCRKLDETDSLAINDNHPAVAAIMASRTGYGCGWADTSRLFSITEDEAKLLREAAKPVAKTHDAAAPPKDWKSPRGMTLTEEMEASDSIY